VGSPAPDRSINRERSVPVFSPAVRGVGNPDAVIKQSRLHYGMSPQNIEDNIFKVLGFKGPSNEVHMWVDGKRKRRWSLDQPPLMADPEHPRHDEAEQKGDN